MVDGPQSTDASGSILGRGCGLGVVGYGGITLVLASSEDKLTLSFQLNTQHGHRIMYEPKAQGYGIRAGSAD